MRALSSPARALLAVVTAMAFTTVASGARDWLKELEDIKKDLSYMDVESFRRDIERYNASAPYQEGDATPSEPAVVCTDTNHDCNGWAGLGECEKNPDFMKVACPKSCDSCPTAEAGGGGGGCADTNNDCKGWADLGECEKNADYMKVACPKSCDACPAAKAWATPGAGDWGAKPVEDNPPREDTPAPTPEDTPAPTPEDTPAPTPEDTPAPTPEDTPAPTPEDTPAPTPQETPAPAPAPIPGPEQAVPGCKDNNEDCGGWAEKGECKENPDYMKVACPRSCDACPAAGDGGAACADTNEDCKGWAELGECEKNGDYMKVACPAACNACPEPAATAAAATAGEATSADDCKDTHNDCKGWAEQGECDKNPDYMGSICPVACDRCETPPPGGAGTAQGPAPGTKPDDGEAPSREAAIPAASEGAPPAESEGGAGGATASSEEGAPSPPAGGGVEGCKDTNEDCGGWAELGECEKNPDYMHVACPVACKKCPTGPSPAGLAAIKAAAVAAAIKEEALAAGKAAAQEAEGASNPGASAGASAAGGAAAGPGLAVSDAGMRAVLAEVPPQCAKGDQDGDCKGWARNGECEKNSKYMHKKCPVACGLCVGAAGDNLDVGSGGAIDFNNLDKTYAGVTKDEEAAKDGASGGAAKSDVVEEADAVSGPVVRTGPSPGGATEGGDEVRSARRGYSWRRWLDPLGLGTPTARSRSGPSSYRNAVPRSMRGPRVAAGGGEHMSFSRVSRAELQRSMAADSLSDITPRPDLEDRPDLLSPKSASKWRSHPFELSHLLEACHHVAAATAVGPTCDTALEESRDYLPQAEYFRHWELVGRDVAQMRHRAFQGWLRDFQGPFPFVPAEGAGLLDAIIGAARALSAAVEKRTPYEPGEGEGGREWPVAQALNVCGIKAPGWGCVFDDLSRAIREEGAASKSVLRILQLDFGDLKKSIAVGSTLEDNRLFRAWLVAEATFFAFRVRGSVQRQIKELDFVSKGVAYDSHAPAIGVHLSESVPADTDDYVAAVRRMKASYGATVVYLSAQSAAKRDEFLSAEGLLDEFHVRYFDHTVHGSDAAKTYGTIADLQLMKRSHMYVGPAGAQFSRVAYWLCYGKNGFVPPYSFVDGLALLSVPDKGRIPLARQPEVEDARNSFSGEEPGGVEGDSDSGRDRSSSRGGRRKSKRGLK